MKKRLFIFTRLVLVAGLVLAGCSHPMGAKRVSTRVGYQKLSRNALTSSRYSVDTEVVLQRYGLTRPFAKDPAAALRALHAQAATDDRAELLFALAELNFYHAEQLQRSVRPGAASGAPDYFLASAIYASYFLFGTGSEPGQRAFDRRFRVACDLYNRAVAQAFCTGPANNRTVRIESRVRQLPAGQVAIEVSRERFKWPLDEIEAFLPADEYAPYGLAVRDRSDGLGAPLIVVGKSLDQKRYPRRFPATLFLRVPGDLKAWRENPLAVSLELISSYDHDRVDVDGRVIPLEGDTTAPLAYALNDASVWKLDLAQFFSTEEKIRSGVYFSQPYRPGRIPVVFVHGTASSPIWWADMWNTLRTDAALRERYQFWNFVYNSGNPISQSANRLRSELTRKVAQLDPEGKDAALRQMVVIGHSQGGLLTKLTATDTGHRLWHTISTNDLASLEVDPQVRRALEDHFIFKALPIVQRVVFIATPHRGSYRASNFVRHFARRFMDLPKTFITSSANLLKLRHELQLPEEVGAVVPSSLDGMSPNNKWLLELAEIPTAPHIKAHSVVAIKGRENPPDGGDGVVRYSSAHVPYVESEFVVRSGHSCQDKPAVIEEVRRILISHLRETKGMVNVAP